jgi:hypothetical protein
MVDEVLKAKAARSGVLQLTVVAGSHVMGADAGGTSSDPYCQIQLLGESKRLVIEPPW